MAPLFLTSTLCGCVRVDPWDNPRHSLDRRLGEPQNWSGGCGVENNVDPCHVSNSGRPEQINE
jgi:hypothetical protein